MQATSRVPGCGVRMASVFVCLSCPSVETSDWPLVLQLFFFLSIDGKILRTLLTSPKATPLSKKWLYSIYFLDFSENKIGSEKTYTRCSVLPAFDLHVRFRVRTLAVMNNRGQNFLFKDSGS